MTEQIDGWTLEQRRDNATYWYEQAQAARRFRDLAAYEADALREQVARAGADLAAHDAQVRAEALAPIKALADNPPAMVTLTPEGVDMRDRFLAALRAALPAPEPTP
jgi:hypothetical protein